jgi:hypothetical protein
MEGKKPEGSSLESDTLGEIFPPKAASLMISICIHRKNSKSLRFPCPPQFVPKAGPESRQNLSTFPAKTSDAEVRFGHHIDRLFAWTIPGASSHKPTKLAKLPEVFTSNQKNSLMR